MRADLTSAANHTKWEELRLAMYGLPNPPAFQCKDLSGHVSEPDTEWFYHFRGDGYATLQLVDILVGSEDQRTAVLAHLQRIGLAGQATEQGFRIYGYAEPGQALKQFKDVQ